MLQRVKGLSHVKARLRVGLRICQPAQDYSLQSRAEEGGHVAWSSGGENQIDAFHITQQTSISENEEHIFP